MKHISQIDIRNFESHQDTVLDLHPGVNVFTGANGVGKSGLLRAIMFVVYNHPTVGFDNMVRWGKTSASVKIDTYDGCWVLREKGKNVNKYVVFDPSQSPEPVTFEGFGTEPPEAVGVALGIQPVSMGKSDKIFLHFSQQDEPTFMLSKSAPEIARWMYSLTNLEDIQAAIDSLNLDYKAKGDSVKEADKRIDRLSKEMLGFQDVEGKERAVKELIEDLSSLQTEEDDLEELQEILDEMLSLKRKALPVKERVDRLTKAVEGDLLPSVDDMIAEVKDLEELVEIQGTLNSAIKAVARARASEAMLIKLDKIDLSTLIEEADELFGLAELALEISDVESRISGAKETVKDIEKRLSQQDKIKEEIDTRASKLRGASCPTCGKKIGEDEDVLKHIVEGAS